jgi:outer membrane protein, heavy metal efflux system
MAAYFPKRIDSASMFTRLSSVVLFGLLGTACVAQDAGYADVRRSVLDRTRHDVRWSAVDGGGRPEERTRRLVSKTLTADGAVQVALLNNPRVQVAFEELGVARADVVRALRLPNPVAEGALHYHGDDPEVELGVLIGLNDLLFLPARSGAAHAALDAAKLSVAGAVLDLALDVRLAYLRYVAARQVVELRRTVLLAANGSYETTKALHEAGNITDLDLANERALYEDARLLVARAETEAVTARARLGSLMGMSGSGIRWETADRLPDADVERTMPADVERRALRQSLDLELARRRFTAAAKAANLSRAEGLLPRIEAGAIAEKEGDEPWGVGPAVEIEIPLFYQGGGEVARARSDMRRQQNSYTAAAVQIRAATQDILARLETARSAIAFYRDVQLPLREQIVQQTQLQYNAMNISVFQLLQAKRDQIETARDYIETQRDYWIAQAELDQLLAGRLPALAMSSTGMTSEGKNGGPAAREQH